MTERINENENKQQLITELNQYVGNAIDRILDEIRLLEGEPKHEYRSEGSEERKSDS